MSENTKIEWCDHTFNPWEGCQKVSPGCDHCYAESRNARFAGGTAVNWGPSAPRRRTSPANWRKPLAWEAAHAEFFAAHGRRQRVFCASLADVFDNAVDPAWRADLFTLIERTPNLDWLLLTKRIGNVMSMVSEAAQYQFDLDRVEKPRLHDNIWIGATIVNQDEADRDIPKLLAVPARVRFLSMEPLLGPVDLTSIPWGGLRVSVLQGWDGPEHGLHWVIVGGESGAGARPMHPDWARSLRDQCAAAGVPFLFKQWGEWTPGENCGGPATRTERVADWFGDEWSFSTMTPSEHDGLSYDDEPTVYRIGKRAAGRLLDGRTHDEFPQHR
ncbi:TPA: phage Gp37/Gp68 family protein [Burkholderia cenocepacia]|uniref:phage Gp37/Gp68 family protein n=1 Tax=Burkholderia cenocepacia TaxID=95486 RepID=UPI001B8E50CD|nr:phage Gp37/Gp68 family protein [Burkholderia cenocepacia]MBR8196364.1 phage Gp37/Gp68 family protein [Burkholderia cenocepacia]HDV6327502.1 phage Gp37/Gp68 family protein [Burkholderia cenocepacia]HDV6351374.1 phage Gp37/Gp68 family protein [Burkholderia cenocepacia]